MLAAGLHDIGKANPFFQYQERVGATSDFAAQLQELLDLPSTPWRLRERLNSDPIHPLRRHEFISHRIVTGKWAWEEDLIREDGWLGVLVGGHHGYWRAPEFHNTPVGLDPTNATMIAGWAEQQGELLAHIERVIGLRCGDVPLLDGAAALVPFITMSGLLTLSDWIASDDIMVERGKELWTAMAPHESVEASQLWLHQRRSEFEEHVLASLGPVATVTRECMTQAVMGDFAPRPLQAEAMSLSPDDDPGLWICMYPTGDGKTEAALLRGAVDSTEGFIFGLPTLATTDAMEGRLQEIARRLPSGDSLPLIKSHQMADHMRPLAEGGEDDGCAGNATTWYSAAIRKLMAPNVVSTVDQVLAGALARRHITLRLFGLANHHVILDEVHTYDAYQTELLIELLYWWGACRARVTLLSATLPSTHMRQMVQAYKAGVRGAAFEAVSDEVAGLSSEFPSTVHVSATDGEHSIRSPQAPVREPQPTLVELPSTIRRREERVPSHIDWARAKTSSHPTSPIAIFTNVVADCVQIAAALLDDPAVTTTHEVLCLHSGLAAAHRQSVERRLAERAGHEAHVAGFGPRSKPVLVIGTQVIQASLDFDVDFAATDLAPAADLIQRLGRVWRFEGSLVDVPLRGGRLEAGARRTLRVVPVVDEHGQTSVRGDLPYLSAIQRRTLLTLRNEIARDPCVDVFEFSQPWVDAAYDKDPTALLSEQDAIVAAATQELVAGMARVNASQRSRAALARSNALGGRPLLPTSASPLWRDLHHLSKIPDDDDLMNTRYVEQQTRRVILVDSSGDSFYWDAEHAAPVEFPRLTAAEVSALDRVEASTLGNMSLKIPAAFTTVVGEAIGFASPVWNPMAKSLTHTPPLDLALLRGQVVYHPHLGLIRKEGP